MIESLIKNMSDNRKKLAGKLSFFDGNIWLGEPKGFPLADEMSPQQFKTLTDRYFIRGGLISHWRCQSISAQEGNASLVAIESELPDHYYIICCGLPFYPKDSGILPGSNIIPRSIRGIRIFPFTHKFELSPWCIGSLCEWMIEHRLPLFIWHTELNWSSIREIALTFPGLPIIIETQTQKILYHTRSLFPVMKECPNIFIETSNFIGPAFIEFAVREFGAERLIFGSFLPVNDPFVPIGMICDASISENEKILIAGATLRQIIGEVRL